MRAGRVVVGVAGVRAGLQRGRGRRGAIECVVLAADASERTLEKVGRLARARGVPVVRGPVARELGQGLGRDSAVQAVGIADSALAKGVVESLGGQQ